MDKSRIIFGNKISDKDYRKAVKSKAKYLKRFGDDSSCDYRFSVDIDTVIGRCIGAKNIILSNDGSMLDFEDNAVIVGNIRMGYGHYRISMAIASCANALGYIPYWLDLNSFPESTATKIISYQNDLYSLGSRLSQKFSLFNSLVWEPMNSEGFRKLAYNASDQKNAELMVPLLKNIPKNIPYLATHAWPAQAAIHAGFERVVNVIPDNWPMALHLSEGSIHVVQTPSSYIGYKMLRGMDKHRTLKPMPDDSIYYTGHYVDHELVFNIEHDCNARLDRMNSGKPRRFLLTIGGAGAQQQLFVDIIKHMIPYVKSQKATLLVNVGDHKDAWEAIESKSNCEKNLITTHFDDYDKSVEFAKGADIDGIHVFYNSDIFAAVYLTNELMRVSDVLITKPSELSFYPVPKLMIHRVGGHEAWGAIRSAEVGDGTYECEKIDEICSMLDEMTCNTSIIKKMCENIVTAKEQGIYNGGYEAVKIATQKK